MEEEEELLTFETSKGKFFYTEAGYKLLDNILLEVHKSKGRIALGYYITNHEAPHWFNTRTRNWFRKNRSKLLLQNHYRMENRHQVFWTLADISKLRELWPVKPLEEIAKILNRGEQSIRSKAKFVMSDEEYENRFFNRFKK